MEELDQQKIDNYDGTTRDGDNGLGSLDGQLPPETLHVEPEFEGKTVKINANGNNESNKLYCGIVAIVLVPILNGRGFELLAINGKEGESSSHDFK